MVARIRITVVDILLTQEASKTCGTLAFIAIGMVDTFGSIETWRAGAVIYINLTHSTTESRRTDTEEAIDFIKTLSVVHTGITQTLINIFFTVNTFKTWHTETRESSDLIQAGGIILAWIRMTFVDVHFTARTCVALQTFTVERAFCVYTFPSMFTWIAICHCTFVHILSAVCSLMALRTRADIVSVHRIGITQSTLLAWIANTCIIQVAQKTCLSFWTNARKRSHSINASRSISTGGSEAIVNVLTAVIPAPTIDTDTSIASIVVGAGTSILTSVGLELTFINIFSAKLACPLRWAAAVVRVHTIHAYTSILAVVIWAVINIVPADASLETWQTVALKSEVTCLMTSSSIHTGRWGTWHIHALTAMPCVAWLALASV